ncbi:MAG TPA: hypothetical protein DE179_12965 [Oceanospirillaceae bacterium]|mgnify:FL=1|nr:hypothetical protein [Oceanospirillaceae bacterium]
MAHSNTRLLSVTLLIMGMLSLLWSWQSYAQDVGNLDKVRLQLKWHHQFQFAGYYAALDKGFYKDVGLDVEIMENDVHRSPVEVLLAGDAEFAVSSAGVLLQRAENKPVVALAAIMQHSPLALLVLKSSGIKQPADLAGKRIMLGEGETAAEVIAMLRKAGLQKGDYQALAPSYNPQDLIDGKTDALFAYVSNEGYYLDQRGIDYRYLSPSRFGVDFYSDLLVTSEAEAANYGQRVEHFRAASMKGWIYAMEHPDEIVDLIYRQYNTQNKARKHLAYEAASLREMIQPMFVEMGYMHIDRWRHIADVFQSLDLLGIAAPIEDLLYHKPNTVWGMDRVLLLWVLLGTVATLVLIAVLFQSYMGNRNLQLLVTQRTKALDQALSAVTSTKEQLEQIVDSINDGLVVVDQEGKIKLFNPEMQRLTGLSSGLLNTCSIDEIIEYNTQELGAYDVQITHTDGYPFPVDVSRAKLGGDDSLGTEVIIIRDLSEQLSAERSRHRDASELAYRAGIAETNATIFHNIGNTVTSLIHQVNVWGRHEKKYQEVAQAMSDVVPQVEQAIAKSPTLAADSFLHRVPQGLQQMGDLVKTNTESLSEIAVRVDRGVNHIAEIIRIQQQMSRSDQPLPDIQGYRHPCFELSELVADAVQLEQVVIDRYQVQVEQIFSEQLPTITCSRNELLQAVINLLRNSREAIAGRTDLAPGDGRIQITAKLNEIGLIEVSISDNGEGIEAQQLAHLFQYGYTNKADGSGFGLHSVANFIRTQGGEINIYSDGVGMGSRVIFTLMASR